MSQLFRLLLLGFVIFATRASFVQAQDLNKWKLVWEDNFDGPKLDYSKWECEVNAFGGGNQEQQLYTDRSENVRVENGLLVIEARKDSPNVQGTLRDYSSARIRTKHRGDWKYARVDTRAKLPSGQGIWPAIWMMPTTDTYGTWASSGEIDIMEYRGQTPNEVLGTLHFGGTWPNNEHQSTSFKLDKGTFADDFHLFSIEWEEGEIRWLVDNKLYQTQRKWNSPNGKFPAPFDHAFHLILNLAVGGGFVGNPDNSTKFPQQLQVDFVKVYQKN